MSLTIQESQVFRRIATVLTALLALGMTGLVGASAASANPSPETVETGSWDPTIAITRGDAVVAEFTMSEATAEELALLEQAAAASAPAEPGTMTPQVQVTAGLGVYVYLNAKDVKTLLTGGSSIAAGLLCAAGGPIAISSCGALAGLVVQNLPAAPPPGYCVEQRYIPVLSFWRLAGTKMVERNC